MCIENNRTRPKVGMYPCWTEISSFPLRPVWIIRIEFHSNNGAFGSLHFRVKASRPLVGFSD
jgi:hypothetical protein